MTTLEKGDAECLLHFVSVADELSAGEPFTPETLLELGRLVKADWVQYCELDRVRCRVLLGIDRAGDDWGDSLPDEELVWDVITNEHPVCLHQQRGNFEALKLSDFVTLTELKRTRTYDVMYRPWDIKHDLSVALPSPLWHTKTLMLFRRRGEFSERDRLVLDLLRPHLTRIWEAGRKRRQFAAALAALDGSPENAVTGAIILDAVDRAEHVSPAAGRLLRTFFADTKEQLPPAVAAWLEGGAREALTVERGSRRLTVERSGDALLLKESTADAGLTAREQDVLGWVARGKTNAEIAETLWISPGTVRKHLENAFAKLGVRTRTAAVARFLNQLDAGEGA